MALKETIKAKEHFQYGISNDIFSDPVTSYAKTAIKALEKQIPQKVRYIEEKNRPVQGYVIVAPECPCCTHRLKKYYKYCPVCGQALDWS